MHNGFLQVEGEKMSKSLGNFVTIHELLLQYPGDALRLNMLRTHYRQPIDWTREGLSSAMEELRTWADWLALRYGASASLNTIDLDALGGKLDASVIEALADDLNTPLAISKLRELFALVRNGNVEPTTFVATARFFGFSNLHKPGFFDLGFSANLFESGSRPKGDDAAKILGYRAATANSTFSSSNTYATIASRYRDDLEEKGFRINLNDAGVLFLGNRPGFESEVQRLISERTAARARKDWRESDRLRDQLAAADVVIKDNKDGTTSWELKR
jgi:cysteinyl-tRNA synthetase